MLSSQHITTACFFAVIYCLLWVNRNQIGALPYAELNICLERNTDSLRADTRKLQADYMNFAEARYYGEDSKIYPLRIKSAIQTTDTLTSFLQHIKTLLRSGTEQQKRETLRNYSANSIILKLNEHLPKLANQLWNQQAALYIAKVCPQHWNDTILTRKPISEKRLITALNIFQHNLALAENATVEQLVKEGTPLCDLQFDENAAIAIPDKHFFLPGEKITGTTRIATWNKAVNPRIAVNKGHILDVGNGVATWESEQSSLGLNKISGTISLVFRDSTVKRRFSFEYMMGLKQVSIQLDKGNTCYVGVNNPLSISIAGYEPNKLSIKVKSATVTQTAPGQFNIYFKQIPKENVHAFVYGTNEEGNTGTVASLPIKVVQLPTPRAEVAGVSSGHIPVRKFRKSMGLVAALRDSDFDMEYTIVSYKLSLFRDHNSVYIQPVKGIGDFRYNPKVMKMLEVARRGDKVIFEEIIARDENGRRIELAPMILKLD